MQAANAAVRIVEAPPRQRMPVRDQITANGAALEAAERDHLDATIGSVEWERRGFLGRLARKGA